MNPAVQPVVDPYASTHVQVTRFIQVASVTLVFYDYFLTLRREIDYVWLGAKTSVSWPRILFFAARYACPIALIVNSVALMGMDISDKVSTIPLASRQRLPRIYVQLALSFGFAIQLSWVAVLSWVVWIRVLLRGASLLPEGMLLTYYSAISQLRLWAMYRSKGLLASMMVLTILALVSMALIEGFGFSNVTVSDHPGPKKIHICGPGQLPHYVYAFWLPPIVVETITVVLVMYKAISHFREYTPSEWSGSRLMSAIVRHSVLYFVIVLAAYLANFCIWLRLPINAFELVIPLTYALPSVAGSRMLLSLREIYHSKRSTFPGYDDSICLNFVNPDQGFVVQRPPPQNEFNSYFGERIPDDS